MDNKSYENNDMDYKSIVRLQASVTVNSKDWEAFKQKLTAVKIIVQSEGVNVLTHETYCQSGGFNCMIIEGYVNEKAFLNHLENIKPLDEKYKVDWKVNRLELSGAFSEQTVNEFRKANKGIEFAFYGDSIF